MHPVNFYRSFNQVAVTELTGNSISLWACWDFGSLFPVTCHAYMLAGLLEACALQELFLPPF